MDLEKSGFTKLRWQNLKTDERTAFYRAYPPDKEMLKRTRVGLIDLKLLEECIAGEAPSTAEANRKFPLHYPMLGRIKNTPGPSNGRTRNSSFVLPNSNTMWTSSIYSIAWNNRGLRGNLVHARQPLKPFEWLID